MIDVTMILVLMAGLSALMRQYLPDKYVPLLNVIVGVLAGYFYIDFGTVRENLLYGALIGLGTAGFIDMAAIPVGKIKTKLK